MKRIGWALLAAFLLGGLAWYQSQRAEIEPGPDVAASAIVTKAPLKPNQPVPQGTIEGLDGQSYRVGGERDKPLLLNFWASWCGPCHEEVPALKQVYARYQGQFDLYAVNVTKGDRMKDVKDFVKGHQVPFPVLLDTSGEFAEAYRILFVPTSYLIDRHGRLLEVLHVLGPEELDAKIRTFLEQEKAA